MRIRTIVAVVSSLTLASVAGAQSLGRMLESDFKNVGKDVLSVWGAPFDASGRDWLLTGVAFGAFGVSMLADQSVSDWAIENKNQSFFRALDPVRRGGTLFSGKYVVPPIAAVYIAGLAFKNQDMRDFVTGCGSAWGAQSPVRKLVYLAVGRARPDSLPGDPQNWKLGPGGEWMMHSFPAGHFANAMACATFWNKRFKMGAAEPAIYALAAAVGIGRFADEAHWFSDTVIGGVLGYAVGSEVARRSLKRNAQRAGGSGSSSGTSSLYLTPRQDGTTIGMRWSF